MSPPTIQAAKTSLAEPRARAMSLVTRKMPVPMVSPMTIAVADHRPRPRIKSDGSGRAARSGRVAHMKVQRAYYQGLRWSTGAACWFARRHERTGICGRRGCEAHLRAIIEAAMAAQKSMLNEFAWDQRYKVSGIEDVLTPVLLMYPESIASNVERTVELLGGDVDRWRAHIKTAKLGYTVRMLVERGIRNFKCATTLELLVACQCGAADVLLAYPCIGANARRVREIAEQFPEVRISVLAENEEQVRQWRGSRAGVFLDINPGMNRTGIERSGMGVPEVITAGTPTFPCSLSYAGFRKGAFIHRISPGTIVYCDATSLAQLPNEYGYRPAVLVLTRVVSRPRAGIVTCDAGHKAVSADAGVPTCVVVGRPELTPLSPSEEHLPMAVEGGAAAPRVGEIESLEKVSARGREAPLLRTTDKAVSSRG